MVEDQGLDGSNLRDSLLILEGNVQAVTHVSRSLVSVRAETKWSAKYRELKEYL
jgi:hypothetical protein